MLVESVFVELVSQNNDDFVKEGEVMALEESIGEVICLADSLVWRLLGGNRAYIEEDLDCVEADYKDCAQLVLD